MEKIVNSKEMKELFRFIAALGGEKEVKGFFRDLCTLSELKAMSERLQIAKRINRNISYREIARETGASTATVTRVAQWFHHGAGGYKMMLHRL